MRKRFKAALQRLEKHPFRDGIILVLLCLVATLIDRLWFALDHADPAWDQGDHLTRAMHYWQVLQHPQWGNQQWWSELWQQSPTYRAPFVYLITAPFLSLFGRGYDQATLVNVLFTVVIVLAVYVLGRSLFDRTVALWAAGFCILSPQLAYNRTDYLLDYGLTAIVTITFLCLTFWRSSGPLARWAWTIGFGLSLGCTMLAKPTGFIYLLVPGIWVLIQAMWQRQWVRLFQLAIATLLAGMVFLPWFQTNWLTILTSMSQSNAIGAREGDPSAATLAGWFYYWQYLPDIISWPLLIVALGCGILSLGVWSSNRSPFSRYRSRRGSQPTVTWVWLLGFCLGSYVICTLATNKDIRFLLPCIPICLLLVARLFTRAVDRWATRLRWSAVVAASLWLAWNLFPLPGAAQINGKHLATLGPILPPKAVVETVAQADPYLRSTIGMVTDSPEINSFNVDFYGTLANFQVYGRQLALNPTSVDQDARSLSWYLTKTGYQGSYEGYEPIQKLRQLIEQSKTLDLFKTWTLPDRAELRLYHRRMPAVAVSPQASGSDRVQLNAVAVPAKVPPGKPIPVTYQLSGSWNALRSGLLVLTWQQPKKPAARWFHDHGIGLGQLQTSQPTQGQRYQLTEHLAMQPSAALPPGTYTLQATYLNRQTGETYPLDSPPIQIQLDPKAPIPQAPEPDLVTQLYQLAKTLPQGKLDPVFTQVGQFNQYDPVQDYLKQAQKALTFRLKQDPNDLPATYTLALTHILQRQATPAIAVLTRLTQLDPQNPYAWAYLAFVHLYRWQPQQADAALQRVVALNPRLPELRTLQIATAAMQLKLPQVWSLLHQQA